MHAVEAMIPTAAQSMSTFEHTDPAFTPDAPPLAAAEPALAFMGAPRGRFRAAMRQDHPAYAAVGGGPFVGGRTEAAIAGREIRRAVEDRLVSVQGRRQALQALAGTIVRMPACVPHAVDATAPARMLLVMLREPKA